MTRILHLFENIGEGAFVVDDDQRIVLWNAMSVQLFGYSAPEAEGQFCWQLLRGQTANGRPLCHSNCSVLARAQRGQPVQHFDVQMTHRNGQKLLVNVSTLPVPDAAREATEAMVHLLRPRASRSGRDRRLRVAVLGPLRAWHADGSPVNGPHWRRTKVRALFACLALDAGHPVPRERILDLLWPEMPYEAALSNLNTTVYHLRRSLEPDLDQPSASRYVVYEAGYYQLRGSFWLDATEFEHTISRARHESDPVQAIRLYRIATELYRGGFLSDLVSTSVWSDGEHTRLQELYLAALEELGELYETQQEPDRAESTYLQALATDPCRETACQKLMRFLLRQGDRTGAAMHCSRLFNNLVRELNIETSPETKALCREARCDAAMGEGDGVL